MNDTTRLWCEYIFSSSECFLSVFFLDFRLPTFDINKHKKRDLFTDAILVLF